MKAKKAAEAEAAKTKAGVPPGEEDVIELGADGSFDSTEKTPVPPSDASTTANSGAPPKVPKIKTERKARTRRMTLPLLKAMVAEQISTCGHRPCRR